MSRSQTFYARVEPDLKEKAEAVFARLGMSSSDAINIFLSQVVLNNGLPFEVKIPQQTKENAIAWLMTEIQKGEDSYQTEPLLSLEESRKALGV